MSNKDELIIDNLESLAFILAAGDGISEEEGFAFESFRGRLGIYLQIQEAIFAYEKNKKLDEAMKFVKGAPIMHHEMTFGFSDNQMQVREDMEAVINSDDPMGEYESLIKLKASTVTEPFYQKIGLISIEDVLSEDGMSSVERSSLIILSRCWSLTLTKANDWYHEYVHPILEEANKLPPEFG